MPDPNLKIRRKQSIHVEYNRPRPPQLKPGKNNIKLGASAYAIAAADKAIYSMPLYRNEQNFILTISFSLIRETGMS